MRASAVCAARLRAAQAFRSCRLCVLDWVFPFDCFAGEDASAYVCVCGERACIFLFCASHAFMQTAFNAGAAAHTPEGNAMFLRLHVLNATLRLLLRCACVMCACVRVHPPNVLCGAAPTRSRRPDARAVRWRITLCMAKWLEPN